jgi:hypothetical protein
VPVEDELPITAIRLTAESTAGRRNRIGTLLAEPVPKVRRGRGGRGDTEGDERAVEHPETD